VWDFGTSFRRGHDKFIYENPPFGQNWIGEIARYARFQQAVRSVWQAFLANSYPSLDAFIDHFAAQISAAAVSDGLRWLKYSQANMSERKRAFKYNLAKKMDFLRSQWGEAANGIETQWSETAAEDGAWFLPDGRRLSGKPTRKGIYLHQGRKVLLTE
jgi:hypothetical protein